MPPLTHASLRAAVDAVVRRADTKGDIDAGLFTLKIAKQQIAKSLGVGAETLNDKPWKQTVKDLVFEAIESIDTLKSSPTKRTASPVTTDVAVLSHLMSDEERERRREEKRGRGTGRGKGAETKREVQSSDESERPSAPARRRKKLKLDPDSDSDADAGSSAAQALSRFKSKKTFRGPKVDPDDKEEGDGMNEVDDVPRGKGKTRDGRDGKRKEGNKPVNGQKTVPKDAKPSASTGSLAPVIDDERVKELKSIVIACGVRKQWKKEFQGLDTAEAQIAHLRRLLVDLGMRGQPTRGKARVIKEKREMAAELGDVLEFEAKRGLGITRRSGASTTDRPASRSPSPPARAPKARASRTEERAGSRSEEDGSGSGTQDEETEDTGNATRRQKRKMVALSEDSDTE
ncbi:hypothetical protein NliqN6_3485 [Naganishia liquefaciens]|uniref:Transcriptional regulator n=1 Tax=Naganishia liquefaciens TaxID=104408 RepID=A0A8H3YFA4_9TREE|nr:hypothetical protein NliqN6_3485 [Naganishia liquefaciens]